MKLKTSELQGAALDWAVADCDIDSTVYLHYSPSTDWAHGGPIIERERINVCYDGGGYWCATTDAGDPLKFAPTPLVAAMRCYVASKLGDEVEVPDELQGEIA